MTAPRSAVRQRRTRETNIAVHLAIDGGGQGEVATGLPFLDHLLRALAMHARFDLEVKAAGDLEVDAHHTVEDVALVLGEALGEALGDRAGIARDEQTHRHRCATHLRWDRSSCGMRSGSPSWPPPRSSWLLRSASNAAIG